MSQQHPHPMSSWFSRPVWQPSLSSRRSSLAPGSIVAFRISSKRTAQRFTHPYSKPIRNSIQNLHSGIYLGLVNSSIVHQPLTHAEECANNGHGRHEIQIAPIGLVTPTKFLLKDSDYLDVDLLPRENPFEEFCAPLQPHSAEAASKRHPSNPEQAKPSRKPLRSNKPLPWHNTLIYTTINIHGTVGTIHGGGPTDEVGWKLDEPELARFDYMADEDETMAYEARMKSSRKRQTNTTPPYCELRGCPCKKGSECIGRGVEIASDQLALDLWLDLNVAGEVRDPHEFHKEWLYLNRMVRSCCWQEPQDTEEALPDNPRPETALSRLKFSWNDLSKRMRWGISAAGIGVSMCGMHAASKMVELYGFAPTLHVVYSIAWHYGAHALGRFTAW